MEAVVMLCSVLLMKELLSLRVLEIGKEVEAEEAAVVDVDVVPADIWGVIVGTLSS